MSAIGGRANLGACVAVLPVALAVTACGSQRESSRVQSMIEAKYGVNVLGCNLVHPAGKGGGVQRWYCDLSAPRKDTATGETSTSWCVANASPDDEFESASLAHPRSGIRPC